VDDALAQQHHGRQARDDQRRCTGDRERHARVAVGGDQRTDDERRAQRGRVEGVLEAKYTPEDLLRRKASDELVL
jgi:hypothetical protein